jgi:hypothetical protein
MSMEIKSQKIEWTLSAGGPRTGDFAMVTISLAGGGISKVQAFVHVPWNLSIAHTEEEYDKAGLYEVIEGILGTECPSLDKLQVYRFLENTVKPKISSPEKTTSYDLGIRTNFSESTPEIPFCGKQFSYHYNIGSDTDDITLDNPHGVSSITVISFAR